MSYQPDQIIFLATTCLVGAAICGTTVSALVWAFTARERREERRQVIIAYLVREMYLPQEMGR